MFPRDPHSLDYNRPMSGDWYSANREVYNVAQSKIDSLIAKFNRFIEFSSDKEVISRLREVQKHYSDIRARLYDYPDPDYLIDLLKECDLT